jgi:hypothetical protein
MKKYGFLAGFFVSLMLILLSIGSSFMHMNDAHYRRGGDIALLVFGLLLGSISLIGYRYQKAAEKQENPIETEVQTLAAYADYTKSTSKSPPVAQSSPPHEPEQPNQNQQGGVTNG